MRKSEFVELWRYERTHNVEPTTGIRIDAHCYDDGQGAYCVRIQTLVDGRVTDSYLDSDAVLFVAELNDALD